MRYPALEARRKHEKLIPSQSLLRDLIMGQFDSSDSARSKPASYEKTLVTSASTSILAMLARMNASVLHRLLSLRRNEQEIGVLFGSSNETASY
jgi:hypothetical protein